MPRVRLMTATPRERASVLRKQFGDPSGPESLPDRGVRGHGGKDDVKQRQHERNGQTEAEHHNRRRHTKTERWQWEKRFSGVQRLQ